MDAARGTAIVLVIYGHAVGIPTDQGWASPEPLEWVRSFFHPFRMPLLLLLSGMLVSRAIQKPASRYLLGKWSAILWPFIVWNLIRWATRPEPTALWDPDLWLQPGYLWYLLHIAAFYVLALPLRRVPPAAVSLAFLTAWVLLDSESAALLFVQNGTFFFAGYAVSRWVGLPVRLPRSRLVLVSAGAVTVATGILCASHVIPERHVLIIPSALCGAVVIGRLCESGITHGHLGWLQWVGRHSLILYVSHFPVMSATTRLLGEAGILASWLWLANLAIGSGVSIVFVVLQRFPWARWPYRAPRLGLFGARTQPRAL